MRPEINQFLLSVRYFQEGETTWEGMVRNRIAKHAAKTKEQEVEFFDAIYAGDFIPSRITYIGMANAFASSCFVFPMEDDLKSIFQTLSEACQVQKYGGGTGYNFSHLRPKGDLIASSGGEASGPISFMWLFQKAMEVVNRAGKKHAAQMGILNCDHPDIFDFIRCKDIEGSYWTFNISVGISDPFMQAVKKDTTWDLQFNGKVYETVQAKDLWNVIVEHAHHNGDPGVIFLDTVNRGNRFPEIIEASNPCGEQMLPGHVSCNLGSIDLSRFVVDNGTSEIDWSRLRDTVRTGVRFLDGSIENAFWPVDKIREKTRLYRNIGLGVMGWADMLILLGIAYDSTEAVELAKRVMQFINATADDESKMLGSDNQRKNTTVTSIAPTGSIGILADCSSGIEPLFGIVTRRNSYVGTFDSTHWIFEEIAKKRGFYSEKMIAEITRSGSVQNIAEIPADVRALFKTSGEISFAWHIHHQAAFQEHTDNAVSKTINMPENATVEDIDSAYWMAYRSGCKSTTVYRDGSRTVQVLENKSTEREMCPHCNAILFMADGIQKCVTCGFTPTDSKPATDGGMAQRPAGLTGYTYKKNTPIGTAYVTINSEGEGGNDPLEVFLNVGKAGSDLNAISESLGRLVSLILRLPSSITQRGRLSLIAEEMAHISGGRSLGFGPERVRSLPDGIAQVLKEYLADSGIEMPSPIEDICPDCGNAELQHVEGCAKCASCGYSEC